MTLNLIIVNYNLHHVAINRRYIIIIIIIIVTFVLFLYFGIQNRYVFVSGEANNILRGLETTVVTT